MKLQGFKAPAALEVLALEKYNPI